MGMSGIIDQDPFKRVELNAKITHRGKKTENYWINAYSWKMYM